MMMTRRRQEVGRSSIPSQSAAEYGVEMRILRLWKWYPPVVSATISGAAHGRHPLAPVAAALSHPLTPPSRPIALWLPPLDTVVSVDPVEVLLHPDADESVVTAGEEFLQRLGDAAAGAGGRRGRGDRRSSGE
ncbi:magnesium transporter 7 [Striga asiatica]|uniref:Magnesium transporter 7 n=1 Tax=Striga asiatica TaxID=4170 RepID=A0A5A7R3A4_STRAF|nr:magnesium transporter 7 [Striga asiatica]